MRVHIVSQGVSCESASISLEDGTPLRNVAAATIRMVPGEPTTALLQFIVPSTDLTVSATVTPEHLRELAAAHGFELVKK